MYRSLTALSFAILASVGMAAPGAWVLNTNMTKHRVNVATNGELPITSNPFQSDSLARTPSGALVSADANGNLWDVTGAPIPVGPTGRTLIGDLDYGAGGLWGFSNASKELFFYDLGSNTVTYAATITLPGSGSPTVTGVAYQQGSGDIFLSANVGLNTDRLLRIPFSTTSALMVGAMTISDAFSYIADLDFSGGTLYAMTFFHREFYTVNTGTGATTLVSVGPHRDTTAMALDPVPEPATWTALALGALAFGSRRQRSRPSR